MFNKVSLIIIAMEEEFIELLNSLNDYEIIDYKDQKIYKFNIKNKTFLALRGKIGKVSTALFIGKLSSDFNIERVYNLGTSGGYNASINVGDVVIADSVIYHDVDVTAFNRPLGQVPECPLYFKPERVVCDGEFDFNIHYGLIASGDSFITKDNYLNYNIKNVNPLCVEMEAGAVAQSCYILNIPFVIIRSISDHILSNDNASDFNSNISIASRRCVNVLLSIINN